MLYASIKIHLLGLEVWSFPQELHFLLKIPSWLYHWSEIKKKNPIYIDSISFFLFFFFFVGKQKMGRGRRLVWLLPYLGMTIVAPYPLSGKTPYSRSVWRTHLFFRSTVWDGNEIRSTNTQLVAWDSNPCLETC